MNIYLELTPAELMTLTQTVRSCKTYFNTNPHVSREEFLVFWELTKKVNSALEVASAMYSIESDLEVDEDE